MSNTQLLLLILVMTFTSVVSFTYGFIDGFEAGLKQQ
jgi:hypothetical protein